MQSTRFGRGTVRGKPCRSAASLGLDAKLLTGGRRLSHRHHCAADALIESDGRRNHPDFRGDYGAEQGALGADLPRMTDGAGR